MSDKAQHQFSSLVLISGWLACASGLCWLRWLHKHMDWQPEHFTIFGRRQLAPRMSVWFGPAYSYGGLQHPSASCPDLLVPLMQAVSQQAGVAFNGMLATLYRNGSDYLGWHADNEAMLGKAPVLAVLSLGASRQFGIRRYGEKRMLCCHQLNHGDLAIMPAGFQSSYQHRIQKTTQVHEPRISLSFRLIQS